MELYFATHNQNKVAELKDLLPDSIQLRSLSDLRVGEIEETGKTIRENSGIKAEHIFTKYGFPCFADDSGLEVAALKGAPGVHSARYAGPENDANANMDLLLANLENATDRSAQFVTIITYIDKVGKTNQFEGIVKGKIIDKKIGITGFGYDPIFKPEGYSMTFAEMSRSEKNSISHRGIAVRKFIRYLSQNS